MRTLIVIFTFIAFQFHQAFSQTITNVKAASKEDKIIITYKISGSHNYQTFNISVYYSDDNGKTYKGPLKYVSGDVGQNIKGGEKQIIWDAIKETRQTEASYLFEIKAEIAETAKIAKTNKTNKTAETVKTVKTTEIAQKTSNRSLFISFWATPFTPFGIGFGMLSNIGFYGSFRINQDFAHSATYRSTNSVINNFDGNDQYYIYNRNVYSPSLSFTAGPTFRLSKGLFLFTGIGYGYRNILWQIDKYSYNTNDNSAANNQYAGKAYVKVNDSSYSGIMAETGGIIKMNNFLIIVGGTTLSFKKFMMNFGIGYNF